MSFLKKLLIVTLLAGQSAISGAVEIVVTPPEAQSGMSEAAYARLLQGVQSGIFKIAIKHAGTPTVLPADTYTFRVPCPGIADGNFATISLNLKDDRPMQLTFISCGVHTYQ